MKNQEIAKIFTNLATYLYEEKDIVNTLPLEKCLKMFKNRR